MTTIPQFNQITGIPLSKIPSGKLVFACTDGDLEVHFCFFFSKCRLIYDVYNVYANSDSSNGINFRLPVEYPKALVYDCALAIYGEVPTYYPEMYRFFDFLLTIDSYLKIEKYIGTDKQISEVNPLYMKIVEKDIEKCRKAGVKFAINIPFTTVSYDGHNRVEKTFALLLKKALSKPNPKEYYNKRMSIYAKVVEYPDNFQYARYGLFLPERNYYSVLGDSCYDRIGSFRSPSGGFKCVVKIPGSDEIFYLSNYMLAKEMSKYDWVTFSKYDIYKDDGRTSTYGFVSALVKDVEQKIPVNNNKLDDDFSDSDDDSI